MEKSFKVKGMTCNHCVKAVEMELKNLDLLNYSVGLGSIDVEYDENKIDKSDVEKAVLEAGYEIIK